ncbi:MAG: hypothetical protein KME35_08135 [Aphanocapsa sp. GSE-SYN-MK-11-07L]|jgi:hypothetical protein|nr:hypothetical protein [Aphanocapsa sp. GSE-SYN-MK-11-07L]
MEKKWIDKTIAASVTSATHLGMSLEQAAVKLKLPLRWQFWGGVAIAVSTTIGVVSFGLMLRQPSVQGSNCQQVFWPFASASFRLYCAETSANQGTLEDLLTAIQLIDGLGKDHPLNPEISRRIEAWSTQVLDLAELSVNQGEIERAIKVVQQIPAQTSAYPLVQKRVAHWRKVWAEGEAIYQKVEAALREQDWRKAFSIAIRLVDVDNRYWARDKFQAINQRIIIAQMDDSKLNRARSLLRREGLDNLKEAMKIARGIPDSSDFYPGAQDLVKDVSQTLLDLADTALANQDLQLALVAAQEIPAETPLWNAAQDYIELANVEASTWTDNVADLEVAIARVRAMPPDRPLYAKAQTLIQRWQADIQTVQLLALAHRYAEAGGTQNLQVAISQAQQVPATASDVRRKSARKDLQAWTEQLQTLQDQPLLDRAEQLAATGSLSDLRNAIGQALQILPGRPLYVEAQTRIQLWNQMLQVATLPQPTPTPIEETLPEQQWVERANTFAQQGTPQALTTAIQIINQVPLQSAQRADADQLISQWGEQMLALARTQAETSLPAAIAIAKQIPSFSSAYSEAQSLIQAWRARTGSQTGT